MAQLFLRVVGYYLFGLAAIPLAAGIYVTWAWIEIEAGHGPPAGNDVVAGLLMMMLLPSIMLLPEKLTSGYSGIWIATVLNMGLWTIPAWLYCFFLNRDCRANSEK